MKSMLPLESVRTVANAPKGIDQLRVLIYELAFQGRLVEHGNDDARDLVDHLLSIKSHPTFGNRSQFTVAAPFHRIPKHWCWVNLGLVGHEWGQQKPNGDFTYIDVSSIDNRKGAIKNDVGVLTANAAPSRARKLVRYGTIVYSTVRPYLLNIAIVDREFDPMPIASTAFAVLHPQDGVESRYVYHYLRSPAFVRYVESVQSGIAYPAISDRKFFAGSFPLPPQEEQKRIVAKVDELMRLCDRLESQQQERAKLLPILSRASHTRFVAESSEVNLHAIFSTSALVSPDELGNSICSLAVSGRIVPPQSDDHDVSKVLANYDIDAVDPPDAPSLPKHWKWVRLGDATTTMNSGWSPACPAKPANPNQWGVLKTTAVQTLEYLEHENKALPTNLQPRPEAEVHDGDILLTRAGPSNRVGVICVARPTRPRLMISDKIIRLHLIKEIVPDFGALALNTGYTSGCIAKLKSGMAASQMNISQPKLRSVPIPVPPVGEQLLILERVAHLLTLVRRLAEQKRKRSEVLESFAKAAIAEITSTEFKENEILKPPKTEVMTALKVGSRPKKSDMAPLTTLLSDQKAEASAKALWQLSGLEIDVFYRQLKTEIANGWIEEDTTMRDVKEVEVG